MKRIACIAIVVALSSLALGQTETPKLELTGAYQLLHQDKAATGTVLDRSWHGWNIDGTAYLTRWFGISANIAGNYTSANILGTEIHFRQYQYLFGPTLKYRTEHFEPYAHALFGISRFTQSDGVSSSNNGFGLALGGGVDVPFSRHFGARLGNLDYFMARTGSPSKTFNNLRFSAGLQFRF